MISERKQQHTPLCILPSLRRQGHVRCPIFFCWFGFSPGDNVKLVGLLLQTSNTPSCLYTKSPLSLCRSCTVLCDGLTRHCKTRGGWKDLCPLREVIQRHHPTLRAQFLPAQKQGSKPRHQDICSEHLCPAVTDGPAEIVCHQP